MQKSVRNRQNYDIAGRLKTYIELCPQLIEPQLIYCPQLIDPQGNQLLSDDIISNIVLQQLFSDLLPIL